MKLILHIGAEKTGTTSIQAFLLQNKQALQEQGFYYLHMKGRIEYRQFPAYCMNDDRINNYFLLNKVTNAAGRERFNRQFLVDFKQSVEAIPSHIHTVILSSEHFSSCLHTTEEVAKATELLRQYFSSIQVIYYLRDQTAKICSNYSTGIKSGRRLSVDDFFMKYMKDDRDDYNRVLNLWEQAFGVENIIVRLFERGYFVKGSLLNDFCHCIDESLMDNLTVSTKQKNEALSRVGCNVMRHVNYCFPIKLRAISYIEKLRVIILKLVMFFLIGKSIKLTTEQAQQVRQRFKLSNATVCEKYFPERDHLFETKL